MRILLIAAAVSVLSAQTIERPVRAVSDPGVVTTRQAITPAGVPTVFQGRVHGVTFGASPSEIWVLHANRVYRLDWRANRILDNIALQASAGLQGIVYDTASARALVAATQRGGDVRLLGVKDGHLSTIAGDLGRYLAGSLAVAVEPDAQGRRLAVAAMVHGDQLAVIDVENGKAVGTVRVGIAPFGPVINRKGTVAYVSNWGGRVATAQDLTAPAGPLPTADKVVVNDKGIAATGTVSRVDLAAMRVTETVSAGLHPTGVVWDEPRARLYVANGNSDSISVIDTRQNRVAATWSIQPFDQKATGIAPTAVSVSPDGKTLYAACGGINAVVVFDTASGRLKGMIPTAWYPNSVAVSADGKEIAVASLLGEGSGWQESPGKRYVHAIRGAVSVIDAPDDAQLASYTTAVAENNRMRLQGAPAMASVKAANTVPVAIPARAGQPSLIEHVVFIIKENRTYDQVLGDMSKGNGDPSLVMFGEDVTPNQHRLADRFGLLDNFYASGGNSADGHQWLTQANETDYCLWPGYAGRSYPFDGTDPIAYSHGGFIWDAALQAGKTVRIFGEYAGHASAPSNRQKLLERWKQGADFTKEWRTVAPIAPLNKILAAQYPNFTTSIPDVVRSQIFLEDLKQWKRDGNMPNLVMIQLPSNHTNATAPGSSSPKAMIADNDLALGQIVEGLTNSSFWKSMAIFVVEDDASFGVDHVDGHRTVALAISPYSRPGNVDSTFYSHQSILKTIELILGMPSLSLFDLIANDMRASFHNEPDFTAYTAATPSQSLFEMNAEVKSLNGQARKEALESAKMHWEAPDAVPSEKVSRILWHAVKGWGTPYPGSRHAVFAPLSVDVDDDDRRR